MDDANLFKILVFTTPDFTTVQTGVYLMCRVSLLHRVNSSEFKPQGISK